MKKIPISAAKRIAEAYGYDQVVIYGRKVGTTPEPHGEHLTSYGVTKEHCRAAVTIVDALMRLMKWGT